jgi:hypothetical protein
MPAHERRWRSDVDDAAVIDDGDAVAQALGLLHQVCRQEHRLASIADAADEIPDRAARLRVEACGQLVEKHHFGVVDQRKRDEQALFLPPDSVMNQAFRLSPRPSCSSRRSPSTGLR